MPTAPRTHLVVVPHTHWDREWYLTHEQFRIRLVHLIDDLLDLLEGDPDYRHFTLDGQSIVVDDYLELRPHARERIAKLVAEGRLMVGPWYVLPDEWLVSGEALVRNLRRGLAAAESLGGAMRLGYVPDQFGHVGQLPQIFRGFGFDAAVLWRGVGGNVRETLFDWRAPDGSSVLTVYLPYGYSNGEHLPGDPDALAARLAGEIETLGRRSRVPTLLVMNGSDHATPDPMLPRNLAAALESMPAVTAEIGTLVDFVERARSEAPAERALHAGELRSGLRSPLLPGCASARMPQKIADFENDRLLVSWLEPLSAWLSQLGGRADPAVLDYLWTLVLENHPHDSICGCSVDAVHDQMDARFARVRELGAAELDRVGRALAARMAPPAEGFGGADGPCLLVWNPAPDGVSPVEVDVELDEDPGAAPAAWHPCDRAGRPLACDLERIEPAEEVMALRVPARIDFFLQREFPEFLGFGLHDITWQAEGDTLAVQLRLGHGEGDRALLSERRAAVRQRLAAGDLEWIAFAAVRRARYRLRFVDSLPGHGLRLYRLARGAGPDGAGLRADAGVSGGSGGAVLANDTWRVEVGGDGRVRLGHADFEHEVDDAVRLVSEGDRGDEYNFDPVADDAPTGVLEKVEVEVEPPGGVSAAVRIAGRLRVPRALAADRAGRSGETVELPCELRLRLWRGVDRLDVEARVDNRARDHRLRLWLGAPLEPGRLRVESAFEIAERPIEPDGPRAEGRQPAEWPIGAGPQRCFAAVDDGRRAASVGSRGLAEVEALRAVGGRGALAVTVLRAVGWLSRDDLVLRPHHAGPPFATPGAQVPGEHRGEVCLRWHSADAADALAEAHRFARPPWALVLESPPASGAGLEDGARLVELDDPALVLSAIEPRPGGGCRLRLYNASDAERTARVRWCANDAVALSATDLAGRRHEVAGVETDGARARLALRPWQIVALDVDPVDGSDARRESS